VLQLFENTPKEYLQKLERYVFAGPVVVIQSKTEARRAVKALSEEPLIGIDTETRPSFRRNEHHKVALLQLATLNGPCYLFRLNMIGLLPEIISLLSSRHTLKVGLSLKDDLRALRVRSNFVEQGFVDIQQLVSNFGIADMSLQKLYANFFGKRISKSAQLSNWESDVLTESQKRYAATDAVACLHIYQAICKLQEGEPFELKASEGTSNQPYL